MSSATQAPPAGEIPKSTGNTGCLRKLVWLGLALLCVVCVLVLTLRSVQTTASERVRTILAKSGAKQPHEARKAGPGAPIRYVKTPETGTLLADLELIGGDGTSDAGRQAEYRRRMEELMKIGNEIWRCNKWRAQTLDFRALLIALGITVPEGMSQAEAAAEFLRRFGSASETLQLLARDLDRAPWAWGEPSRLDRGASFGYSPLTALSFGTAVLGAVSQAQALTGDAAGSRASLEILHKAYAEALRCPAPEVRLYLASKISADTASALNAAILRGDWSDNELREFPSRLPAEPTASDLRWALETKRDILLQRMATEEGMNALRAEQPRWRASRDIGETVASWLSAQFMTDSRIEDSFSIGLADLDVALAHIDDATGLYSPPVEWPSMDLRQSVGTMEVKYFDPLWHADWLAVSESGSLLEAQRQQQEMKLAVALELFRREHGGYPASLDALAAASSAPVPRGTFNGAAWQYQGDAAGYQLRIEDIIQRSMKMPTR